MVWSILAADMGPGQQAAAIARQLRGEAQTLIMNLSYVELTQGAVVNGVQMDLVTYMLTQLASHFAPLGEESRLQATDEIMGFIRNSL